MVWVFFLLENNENYIFRVQNLDCYLSHGKKKKNFMESILR